MDDNYIIIPFVIIYLYPYKQELLNYKRDGTLAYLKSQIEIAFYNGKLSL